MVLQGVTRATSGDYQCEVIGDRPNFRKEASKARLNIFCEYHDVFVRSVVSGSREFFGLIGSWLDIYKMEKSKYLVRCSVVQLLDKIRSEVV